MIPLRVSARLVMPVCSTHGRVALDALVTWAACRRDGLGPLVPGADPADVPIPIAKSACGRVYLASFSQGVIAAREVQRIYRRFPQRETMLLGPASLKSVPITTGPGKSTITPLALAHLTGNVIEWFCVGEPDELLALLRAVRSVGKKRALLYGEVAVDAAGVPAWSVELVEPWEGFPVVRAGVPLRPLPIDWPGVSGARGMHALLPPYDARNPRREMCWVPPPMSVAAPLC